MHTLNRRRFSTDSQQIVKVWNVDNLFTISLCSVLMHHFLRFRFYSLRHLTFRRNYFRASSLFFYYENHTQSTVMKKKRLEIHRSTLNAHWRHAGKPFRSLRSLYAAAVALATTAGVLGNGCLKPCINTFSYYRSTFKRRTLLS